VSVTSGSTRRRWAAVTVGVAVLCSMPVVASALPVSVPAVTAQQLRTRILDSQNMPYSGYAESDATFGLPALAGLSDMTGLFDGVTKMRVWQASPDAWRVDVLSDAAERDTYELGQTSYIWDSGNELLTKVIGQSSVRLPRPADLVPPALAMRLLREAGTHAKFTLLPPQRVAGLSAVGLRMEPTDPASTIGQVDIWAEPDGLPLLVAVIAKGATHPALESQFFQVSPWHPDKATLTPVRGPGTGYTTTGPGDFAGALRNLDPELLPGSLAGRNRIQTPFGYFEIGLYGGGLSTFAVLTFRGQTGHTLLADAQSAGGTKLTTAEGTGVLIKAQLITAVLMQRDHGPDTFLVVGLVGSDVLERAAATLVATRDRDI
jgi:hypothetical protein